MRVFARRERPHPGAQMSPLEAADGWRHSLWATNLLRYRLLHAAARLVRGGRRRTLKIAATWPWTDEITTAWQRIQAIPHPI